MVKCGVFVAVFVSSAWPRNEYRIHDVITKINALNCNVCTYVCVCDGSNVTLLSKGHGHNPLFLWGFIIFSSFMSTTIWHVLVWNSLYTFLEIYIKISEIKVRGNTETAAACTARCTFAGGGVSGCKVRWLCTAISTTRGRPITLMDREWKIINF